MDKALLIRRTRVCKVERRPLRPPASSC